MGCVFSKHFGENNPRFFQVWNVDDHGNQLNPGKIEVTRLDLVLHQKGKQPIRWPLRCLRRYGFDAELFSFESGRRCPTGPGIYAFKCRQAEALFNTVQEFIQCRNSAGPIVAGNGIASPAGNDERVGSISGPTVAGPLPSSASSNAVGLPAAAVQNGGGVQGQIPLLPSGLPAPLSVDNVGYLEPISVAAAVVAASQQPRSSSLSSTTAGVADNVSITAVSPARSSLPGLYSVQQQQQQATVPLPQPVSTAPIPTTCSCSACNAINRNTTTLPHQYVNSSVVVPDKQATVARTMAANTDSATRDPFYVNGTLTQLAAPLRGGSGGGVPATCGGAAVLAAPPSAITTYVDQNTNYARLDDLLKQEQQHSVAKRQKDNNRFYENVTPEPMGVAILGLTSKTSRSTPTMSRSSTVTSPTGFVTPKSPVVHFYANLNSPPAVSATGSNNMAEVILPAPDIVQSATAAVKKNASANLEDDPQEQEGDEPRVNYITLDLNHSQPLNDLSEPANSPPPTGTVPPPLSPPGSPGNPAEGYATIDFDKTAALSNSSNPGGILDDSIRKTRHNSAVPISLALQ